MEHLHTALRTATSCQVGDKKTIADVDYYFLLRFPLVLLVLSYVPIPTPFLFLFPLLHYHFYHSCDGSENPAL